MHGVKKRTEAACLPVAGWPRTCKRLFNSSKLLTACVVLPGGQPLPLLLPPANPLALQETPCQEQYRGTCAPAAASTVLMYLLQAAVLLSSASALLLTLNTSCQPLLFSQP
jgi:hypothetical protein